MVNYGEHLFAIIAITVSSLTVNFRCSASLKDFQLHAKLRKKCKKPMTMMYITLCAQLACVIPPKAYADVLLT